MHFQMRQSGELHLSEGVGDRCAIWFSPLLNHSGEIASSWVDAIGIAFSGVGSFSVGNEDGRA